MSPWRRRSARAPASMHGRRWPCGKGMPTLARLSARMLVRFCAGARVSRPAPALHFVRSFVRTPAAAGPIRLHPELPCVKQLKQEGVWVEPTETDKEARTRPEMPVRVCILNLMPLKESTELQLSRMLGRSASHVEITWCVPDNYSGKNSAPGYLDKFYKRFSQIKKDGDVFDGFVVTGAPIEHLPFEEVRYWPEMQEFFEFIRAQDAGMLSLCWGAMASIYHFHGIPKHVTSRKEFGVFQHQVLKPTNVLSLALPGEVGIPVSRHTTWKQEDFEAAARKAPQLELLLSSDLVGPGLIWDSALGHAHMINHFE
jgi:homoserine O-succinyltransferase